MGQPQGAGGDLDFPSCRCVTCEDLSRAAATGPRPAPAIGRSPESAPCSILVRGPKCPRGKFWLVVTC
eukprot:6275666-Prymnesium_polylepis.2